MNSDSTDQGTAVGRLSHEDALQWSLWRILVQHTCRRGAKVIDVLDTAEARDVDRFWATEMLMFWLERGDIRRSCADNHIVPQRRWWTR